MKRKMISPPLSRAKRKFYTISTQDSSAHPFTVLRQEVIDSFQTQSVDVHFHSKEGKVLSAHRSLLAAVGSEFLKELMEEKEVHLQLADVEGEEIQEFIRFVYGVEKTLCASDFWKTFINADFLEEVTVEDTLEEEIKGAQEDLVPEVEVDEKYDPDWTEAVDVDEFESEEEDEFETSTKIEENDKNVDEHKNEDAKVHEMGQKKNDLCQKESDSFKWKCTYCLERKKYRKEVSLPFEEYRHHVQIIHKVRSGSNICEKCSTKLSGREELMMHLCNSQCKVRSRRDKARAFSCQQCSARFFGFLNMVNHVKMRHVQNAKVDRSFMALYCEVCWRLFRRVGQVKEHEKAHEITEWTGEEYEEAGRVFDAKMDDEQVKSGQDENLQAAMELGGDENSESVLDKRNTVDTKNGSSAGENDEPSTANLECKFCARSFTSRSGLNRHFATHHMQDQYYGCPHCHTRFATLKERTDHKSTCLPAPRFSCDECPETFARLLSLDQHQREHHGKQTDVPVVEKIADPDGKRRFRCSGCEKTFNWACNASRHIELVHLEGPKQLQCDRCPYRTNLEHRLRTHKAIHGKPSWVCDQCGHAVRTPEALKRHMNQWHSDGTFMCHFCAKVFSHPQILQRHVREVHPGSSKQVACPKCGKVFSKKKNLRVHLQETHAEAKAFECNCGAAFKRKGHLQRHKKEKRHFCKDESPSEGE